jgi:peptidoglycan/xylan/chitin deacetylase (PgdA/CDA1 family)
MKFNYLVSSFVYNKTKNFFLKNKKLRIVNLHHIPEIYFKKLKKNILLLSKDFDILDPASFFDIVIKKRAIQRDSILFTFDDGYNSQLNFAKQVLDTYNIKAIFFIVPNFAKIKDKNESFSFLQNNIKYKLYNKRPDISLSNMKWDDIKYLHQKGHVIGAHSLNHLNLTKIENQKKLEEEILSDRDAISIKIGSNKIINFAYPFGDIKSINSDVFKIISKHFVNIFSGVRGNNLNNQNKNFIFRRDAIEADFNIDLIKMFLSGFSDFYYKKDSYILDRLK